MVIQDKVRAKVAAKILGLKISTAKNILKAFTETGKIYIKK